MTGNLGKYPTSVDKRKLDFKFPDMKLILTFFFSLSLVGMAQNTAFVFGPRVDEGDVSFQYRLSAADNDGDFRFQHRYHIQTALNDDLRLRIFQQWNETDSRPFDFSFTQLEAQYQILDQKNGDPLTAAFRGELRFQEDDRIADSIGLSFTGDYQFAEDYIIRTNILANVDYGSHSRDGIGFNVRFLLGKKLSSNLSVALEYYNEGNRSSDLGSLNELRHQLGSSLKYKVGDFSLYTGFLYGLSDSASDWDYRTFITYSF